MKILKRLSTKKHQNFKKRDGNRIQKKFKWNNEATSSFISRELHALLEKPVSEKKLLVNDSSVKLHMLCQAFRKK